MNRALLVKRVLVVLTLVAMLLLASTVDVDSLVAPVYFAAVCAAGIALLPLLWDEEVDPFQPFSYLCIYTIYTMVGIVSALALRGDMALPMVPASADERADLAVRAIQLSMLAFASYAAGFRLTHPGFPAWPKGKEERRPPEWRTIRLVVVTVVCVAAFAISYTKFLMLLGIPLDDSTLANGKATWRQDPSLSWMLRGVQLGFLPILLWGARTLQWGTTRQLVTLAGVALVVAFLVVQLGQRSAAAYPLMALMGFVHYLRRRVPLGLILGAAIIFVIGTNITTRIRATEGVSFESAYNETSMDPIEALGQHEGERGRLHSTAVILQFFPHRIPYLVGESWESVLYLLVPRWIWPEKAGAFLWGDTAMLRHLVGFPAPVPLPALLYANFSYLGVVVGMLLYGAAHARLYAWVRADPRSPSRVLMFMVLTVFANPTPSGFALSLQYVVPIALILWFIRVPDSPGRPGRPGRPASPASPARPSPPAAPQLAPQAFRA